ncbi:MAG: hypothetical protein KAZ98_00970 [Prevotella sp.]|nr:hypothetical protein [Prevotella sp.]
MEQEFEDYWKKHRSSLMAVAPSQLQEELKNNTRLTTGGDWLIFIIPIVILVVLSDSGLFAQEWLNWVVAIVVGVLAFGLMDYVKPYVTGKRRYTDIEADIKQHFYQIYRAKGLEALERIRA